MNTVTLNINNRMKNHSQQYASNDSGLSWNSNGGSENDHKNILLQDFQCDDLTKSLFINSFSGNEIIQDDDIFSYKSKMEINNIFPNKFRSFNLAKSDSFSFKNSSSFSSIIHDVENLTMSQKRPPINNVITPCVTKLFDEVQYDEKVDLMDKGRPRRSTKKNSVQEYVSSSIKDYQGDKALNDIVSFIQGSSKQAKCTTIQKSKVIKPPSIKVSEMRSSPPPPVSLTVVADSGVVSDTSSPDSKDRHPRSIDVDSGTQSLQFASLNNSDEDSSQLLVVEQFQQVLSKKQRKTSCLRSDNHLPLSVVANVKLGANKKSNKTKMQVKPKLSNNSLLQSKESFHHFLSDQYFLFLRKFNSVSSVAT